jgi:colanic acid/amylovoran biosynthesis glycosyltransferase
LGKHALSLKPLFRVIPYLDKGPYDIVHCHFGPIGKIGLYLRGIGALDGKLIVTFHGYDLTLHVKSHGNKVYKELFTEADLIMPISERWKNELIRMGCEEKKIIVHRMGINTVKFRRSSRNIHKNRNIKILSVARFVEKKGLKYGIEAVAKVAMKYNNVKYNIIGGGELRDELERLISDLSIEEHIKLIGWKSQNEIKVLMSETDIFLAPSVTSRNGDQEGIPVVLMEAMASGIPVISTYHSGIPELIEDGKSGFLAPERDVDTLVEKILYLIEHTDKCVDIRNYGRKTIMENFDINTLNDRLKETYEMIARA